MSDWLSPNPPHIATTLVTIKKMNKLIIISIIVFLSSCTNNFEQNISKYFSLVNKAELEICQSEFGQALETYEIAFTKIQKPFGKDLFNAALCSQLSNQISNRNKYLQVIVNNSNELEFAKSKFVGTYLTVQEWNQLVSNQIIDYDPLLRNEFLEIRERDQLYRPMYDTHDDTINANRIINLNRILELTESRGFPSHMELGFSHYLRGQNHDIVLLHTAQRRSRDKTVMDLEPILFNAVKAGRFDPETAIFFMNYQQDREKGEFEVYSTDQFTHPLLPDSLNNKIWLRNLSEQQVTSANSTRKEWYANSLEDIAIKTEYLSTSSIPFVFTCVKKSFGRLGEDFDKETALEQYKMATSFMKEYRK